MLFNNEVISNKINVMDENLVVFNSTNMNGLEMIGVLRNKYAVMRFNKQLGLFDMENSCFVLDFCFDEMVYAFNESTLKDYLYLMYELDGNRVNVIYNLSKESIVEEVSVTDLEDKFYQRYKSISKFNKSM